MLAIKLQRVGKKNYPTYRLIVTEKSKAPNSSYLESVGVYNPHDKAAGLKLETERIQYWISKGAVPTNTVHNLLVNAKIASGAKKKVVYLSEKRKKKIAEKKAAAK